jgi:hypothetical protein
LLNFMPLVVRTVWAILFFVSGAWLWKGREA